jgi:hypothetical protein
MPGLIQSLQGKDAGHLKIVAELWGLELVAPDARIGLQRLAPLLLVPEMVEEVALTLPPQAFAALEDLVKNDGRLPWALFTRRYGQVQEIGPGRRDRERPYAAPDTSPAEALWYRALIAREFFDTATGPQEFAYIPDDLLELLPVEGIEDSQPLGRPASPAERVYPVRATTRLIDDACTLLAALRVGLPVEQAKRFLACGVQSSYPIFPEALAALLSTAGLLDEQLQPLQEPTRNFLELPRGEALALLFSAWLRSATFNELLLLPELLAEGEWRNDPILARGAIMDFLSTIPGNIPGDEKPFWSLPAFISAIRQVYPDFQRPAGDYDSWFLRSRQSGEFLRGFENWEAVDGLLVRFIIAGPLHWLGLLDLAMPGEPAGGAPGIVSAFRFSEWAPDLLNQQAPEPLPGENEKILVTMDGRIQAPLRTPRAVRYQIARFCEWDDFDQKIYQYRLTPSVLGRARKQGLRIGQLLSLLRRHAQSVPPNLTKALEAWEQQGVQAALEKVTILRLSSPEILQMLRSSRAARYLGDPLGPAAVLVRSGAEDKVLAILLELGILGTFDSE